MNRVARIYTWLSLLMFFASASVFAYSIININATDNSATEAALTTAQFTVTRTTASMLPVNVFYTVSGSAASGTDFAPLSGFVAFSTAVYSTEITLTPIDDSEVEPVESVIVWLSTNPAYGIGSANNATVSIISDDAVPLPVVSITATNDTATEAGPTAGKFTVTRTNNIASLTVYYSVGGTAASGTDYSALSGVVVIGAGQYSNTITVMPVADSIVEPNETVELVLSANTAYDTGSANNATVTIISDDFISTPSNFTGIPQSTSSIKWQWNLIKSASYYLVCSLEGDVKGISSGNSCLEADISSNTQCIRYVKAITADGQSSLNSAPALIYTLANNPYSAVITSATSTALFLTWQGNGCSAFKITRSLYPDMRGEVVLRDWNNKLIPACFLNSGLQSGKTYYYRIWGYNGDGILTASFISVSGQTLKRARQIFSASGGSISEAKVIGDSVSKVKVELSPGTVNRDMSIDINPDPINDPVSADKSAIIAANNSLSSNNDKRLAAVYAVELNMYDLSGNRITGFDKDVKLIIPYLDSNEDGYLDGTNPLIKAEEMKIFTLSETSGKWVKVGGTLNTANKTVEADIKHFSVYTLMSAGLSEPDFNNVAVYPNPYKPGSGGIFDDTQQGEGIVFSHLAANAKIRIFTLAGELVREIDVTNPNGSYLWNACNQDGAKVASGIYIYIVAVQNNSGEKSRGKIAVIR